MCILKNFFQVCKRWFSKGKVIDVCWFNKELKPVDLLPGDVLVCFDSQISQFMRSTPYGEDRYYCHSGLCIGVDEIAHSDASKGVDVVTVLEFISSYQYAVVKRRVCGWHPQTLARLIYFCRQTKGVAGFNYSGLASANEERYEHSIDLYNRLNGVLTSPNYPIPQPSSAGYFCSEFVVWAFYNSGLFSDSMLVHEMPSGKTTDEIAKDRGTYGDVVGYIPGTDFDGIPEDDRFRNAQYL